MFWLDCLGIVGKSWERVGIRPRSCMPGPGMLLQPNYPKVLSFLLFISFDIISFSHQSASAVITHKWSWVNASSLKSNERLKSPCFALFFSDVGFKVGGDTKINYFVLQIHYGDIRNFRGKYWCTAQSFNDSGVNQTWPADQECTMNDEKSFSSTFTPSSHCDVFCLHACAALKQQYLHNVGQHFGDMRCD